MENKKVCANMDVWFRSMKEAIAEAPEQKWQPWESWAVMQLGFEREDGLILAYRLASLRKHYRVSHFESQDAAIEKYSQDIRDLFGIKNPLN